ncbi:MAG: PAS domain S-box protein [Caulobacterales bacterium]|nr:PAS domain S-box protein [Caulobacterales bacterium]
MSDSPKTEWPIGGGELGRLIRQKDWSDSPLGPISEWSNSLRAAVNLMLPAAAEMVLFWGAEFAAVYNDAYAPTIGDKHPRVLGRPASEGWAELWDDLKPLLDGVMTTGETVAAKDRPFQIDRQGFLEEVFFDISYSAVRDEDGGVAGVMCIVSETTKRVLAERALTAANRKLVEETGFLRELFEQAPGFMTLLRGPEHVFELMNPPYQRLIGGRNVVGKTVREGLPELEGQGFYELLDQVYRTGETFVGRGAKVILQAADGALEERTLDFVYQPIRGADGAVSGIFVEGSDATDQARAIEQLRIAQTAGGIGAFEWFPATGRLEVSDEYRRIWGFSPDAEINADLLVALIEPEDRGLTGVERLEAANPLDYAEYRIRRPDTGEMRWIARRGEVIDGDARMPRRYVGVSWDITEQKRVQRELQALNTNLEAEVEARTAERDRIWNTTSEPMCIVDLAGVFRAINPAMERLLGWGAGLLVGQSALDYVHVDDVKASADTIGVLAAQPGGEVRIENRMRAINGDYRLISWTVTSDEATIYALGRDITEMRQTEEALRHAQKMEAVGQLTGGIAHDFNNLLTGIIGALDLMKRRIQQGRQDEVERFMDAASTSAQRAAALTHRLLAFARRQSLDPKPTDVNALVASMEELLSRTLGEQVDLAIDLETGLWAAYGDGAQMESALLNLAINARDAMPNGGRLTIETSNVTLPEPARPGDGPAAGDYVSIRVTDTGVGMPPHVAAKAFDPFFTTKPLGQGTGLGLSMIYGFARQSGGHLALDSEVGRGTVVTLHLPRLMGDRVDTAASTPSEAPRGDGETVLLVEDDAQVRLLVMEVLSELGYQTLEAHDGDAALPILRSSAKIDLMVSDVGLPGVNGRQLAEIARETRPDLKVLFVTGYAENAAQRSEFLGEGMEMITKPFALDDLARKIREMVELTTKNG